MSAHPILRPTTLALSVSVLIVCGWPQPAWAQKTDTVVMNNGDRITVEIKKLERGRLEASTDGMGTLLIEWDDIDHLSNPARFEVRTQTGERYVGALASTGTARELVVAGDQSITLALDRVVLIAPANPSFWSQWDGAIDVGYDFAKAGDSTQWTLSSSFTRRAVRLETRLTGSSFFSSKQGAEDTSRHSLGINFLRFIGERWGLLAIGRFDHNDELQLALRSQAGGGYQYRFVQTNSALFGSAAGVAVNREEFLDDTPGQNNVEAVIATRFETFSFDTPKTDVTAAFLVFPSLTDWGRIRLELDVSVRRELVKDFFFSLSFQDSFDSDPPSQNATRNDFNVVSSFGWSF